MGRVESTQPPRKRHGGASHTQEEKEHPLQQVHPRVCSPNHLRCRHSPAPCLRCQLSSEEEVPLPQGPWPPDGVQSRVPTSHSCSWSAHKQGRALDPGRLLIHWPLCPVFSAFTGKHPSRGRLHICTIHSASRRFHLAAFQTPSALTSDVKSMCALQYLTLYS